MGGRGVACGTTVGVGVVKRPHWLRREAMTKREVSLKRRIGAPKFIIQFYH
jgi:hypothetical protein